MLGRFSQHFRRDLSVLPPHVTRFVVRIALGSMKSSDCRYSIEFEDVVCYVVWRRSGRRWCRWMDDSITTRCSLRFGVASGVGLSLGLGGRGRS